MRVLFIMTARGGSKGIPKKNIARLGDYPLLAYKLISARKSKCEKRIIISTDSHEIAETASQYGAEVPFMRPGSLSGDTADSMDVLVHAVDWIKNNDDKKYDYICLLEPTSPFASYLDFNKCFDLLEKTKADALASVKEVDVSSCFIHQLDKNGRLSSLYNQIINMKSVRRQDQPKEYTLNGCVYCVKWDYFEKYKTVYSEDMVPYIMPIETSVDINCAFDLVVAKSVIDNKLVDMSLWEDKM